MDSLDSSDADDDDDRRTIFPLCLAILDQQHMLQSNPHLRAIEKAGRAWDLLGKTYANNPAMMKMQAQAQAHAPRKPIHAAVGRLCLKAWEARQGCGDTTAAPEFVVKLREQTRDRLAQAAAESRKDKAVHGQTPILTRGHEEQAKGPSATAGNLESLFLGMGEDLTAGVDWELWDAGLGAPQ
ncbi:hypothetical protein SCUCBS95973_000712 [Sporothrix curviconia]|uniref:Uncharacterized protein n=1 Tax=Sporothrix curviconia TaxID=1260050 RepID=A0ABP0ASL8_9PEZI